ncbi:PIN domain-containing protein [bacterium]|nr:PIN domain-containing protein [bacterium]MBU1613841.1 PIN domain-containing protein [bacterium]
MKDKRTFVDTNILIYYVSNDTPKKNIAKDLLIDNRKIVISSQVIAEFVAVTTRKQILSYTQSVGYANEFMDILELAIISKETIRSSFEIVSKYGYSLWDGLILAAALENNCSILYTEDLQDGQIIEDSLRITNPFGSKKE